MVVFRGFICVARAFGVLEDEACAKDPKGFFFFFFFGGGRNFRRGLVYDFRY